MRRDGTLFSKLAKDVAGNTLAMTAVAVIPLLAAVGGGIDASRYYMASSRLQNACDSGVLAARKAMETTEFTDEHRDHGFTFFDQNFRDGTFGLEDLDRDFTADDSGTVTGTATGELPTSIMEIFGFERLNVSVTCSAEVNISNTDIMLVLDTTGSMNCPSDGSPCLNGNNNNTEATNSRLSALRGAVLNFYDTIEDATSRSAQVRYGLLPYSSNVNVGRSIPVQYMAASAEYQTRVPQFTETTVLIRQDIDEVSNRGPFNFQQTIFSPNPEPGIRSFRSCQARAAASTIGSTDNYIEGSIVPGSTTVLSETTNGNVRTRVIRARAEFFQDDPVPWWGFWLGAQRCYVDRVRRHYEADFEATIVERIERAFSQWEYKKHRWPVANIYTGGLVLQTGDNGTDQTHFWDGCIEEAQTTTDAVFDPLPAGAYDLDINLIPSNEMQRWKPALPTAVYQRWRNNARVLDLLPTASNAVDRVFSNGIFAPVPATLVHTCPREATRLAEMSREELETFLRADQGFVAQGATYHDIGMIWGSRFVSPRGIFANDNASAPNGDAISRHIIFMTDGELAPNNDIYSVYGMQWWDRRIFNGTSGTDIRDRHAARFQAACRQARQENISVWVIAFGTELTQNLIDCATPGRAFHADDADELQQQFTDIAQRIAALRLTN